MQSPGRINFFMQQKTEISLRKRLRCEVLAARDRLTPADRHRQSVMVENNLWQLDEISRAQTLFVYVNFRSEVETLALIRHCIAKGKRVGVPLTDVKNHRLLPFVIRDPGQDLRPGYCRIPEPASERLTALDPKSIDTVVLPGSVFDEQGGRLGYGGGYYDRFLTTDAPQARRVGIAFEQQIVKQVPLLAHDQRLHILVSEERIIRIA
jgi:5-formyltetrahydrofolate cyclo-ligase